MVGDKEVIRHLNVVLTNELTAVNQYFLHARMLKNWGIMDLAKKVYEESIGEMKHADLLIERVLFLDGLPNVQDLNKIRIGEDVAEMFASDLNIESYNRDCVQAGIAYCEQVKDYGSREIFRQILVDTEEHIDFLETQLGLIKLMGGVDRYVQQRTGKLED